MQSIEAQIEKFFESLSSNYKEGLSTLDAIELAGAVAGGKIAQRVAFAISKYNEATYERTPLFAREDQDRIALLTMGSYYEPHLYEEGYNPKEQSIPEAFGDALFLVLKYPAKSVDELEALSNLLPGSHAMRMVYLDRLKEAIV